MPRKIRLRKVVEPPRFKGYRPFGVNAGTKKSIDLFYEEYEAIKLADYDSLSQLEASKVMGVSRPTFARIYASARQKIAIALTETREIVTVYGHAVLDKDWYQCKKCHSKFSLPPQADQLHCPLCQSENFQSINPEN